jgi:hypothetical protein
MFAFSLKSHIVVLQSPYVLSGKFLVREKFFTESGFHSYDMSNVDVVKTIFKLQCVCRRRADGGIEGQKCDNAQSSSARRAVT